MKPAFMRVKDEVRLIGNWSGASNPDLLPESVDRLSLDTTVGWNPKGGIGFLTAFSKLKILHIQCLQKLDLLPVVKLKNLRVLHLELYPKIRYDLDFRSLSDLNSLNLYWNHGFEGLQGLAKLEQLIIKEIYQVKDLDLSGLSALKTLHLVGGRGVRSVTLAKVCALESLLLAGLPNLEVIKGFCAGNSVRKLNLSSVGKVPTSFWKQFSTLDRVECSPKERITEKSFGSPPKSFLCWPK